MLRTFSRRAAMMVSACAVYVTGARPYGHDRHFCVPATATSIPQSSVATSAPPSVTTQSASTSAPFACATRAISAKGWRTPVEVSPWTIATSFVGPWRSAASMASGSRIRPHSPRTATTSAPHRSAISIISRPKRPHSPTTTRSPGSTSEPIAASSPARPVPDTGKACALRVWNATRDSAMTSFMIAVNSGSNWPSSGVDIARSTRGSAIDGPGPRRMRGPGRRSPTGMPLKL